MLYSFEAGDTVGIGYLNNTVFITKNGKVVFDLEYDFSSDMCPTIGRSVRKTRESKQMHEIEVLFLYTSQICFTTQK